MSDQITYANKTDSVSLGNPANEKVAAVDMNEIKSVVNANAVILDTTEIGSGTLDPNGNVVGNPGDLYKWINVGTFEHTLFMHVGAVANDTDWQVMVGRAAGLLAGSNTPFNVPLTLATPAPIVMPMTIQTTLRITQPTPGIFEYNGPQVTNSARLFLITVSATLDANANVENDILWILRIKPISTGVWADVGFGALEQLSGGATDQTTINATVIGLESGDQYQLWVTNTDGINDIDINSIEWVIF